MSVFDIFKRVDIPNLPPAEFDRMSRSESPAVLLDVRTGSEFNSGNLKGAVHMNVQDWSFASKLEKLDKDAHYFVHCRSGRRSMAACRMMHAKGFKNTYNLAGGILAWQRHMPNR